MPKYEELKAFRKQNLIPEYSDSSSEKTMLHREARALAISRLEESARTEEEFANWAFTFTTSFLYCMDYNSLDEQTKTCIVMVCLHLAEYPRLTISH